MRTEAVILKDSVHPRKRNSGATSGRQRHPVRGKLCHTLPTNTSVKSGRWRCRRGERKRGPRKDETTLSRKWNTEPGLPLVSVSK